ncbi:MAG TPA: hypothetical protein VER03_14020 [Bryobacteraceae bacterium]|nr:hypothetical protein [Bryobacteraceae bacterium]
MKALVLALALVTASFAAGPGPKIFFSKNFPGSIPAFVSIELLPTGEGVYKEAPEDENPIDFKISPEDTKHIFDLAEKLDRFKRPLESNLKVAQMGVKTFRFEQGAVKNEQKFNYSIDLDAQALLDWFERLTETQRLHFDLERTAKFDRLGVNKTLLQIEAAFDRNRLVGLDRFLPLLDRVAKNDSYLHMARERAAMLADIIRTPKPKTTE